MIPALRPLAAAALLAAAAGPATAQDGPTLFTNVNVFDGVNEPLIENANVVVTGNLITAVSTEPLAVAGGRVIDDLIMKDSEIFKNTLD